MNNCSMALVLQKNTVKGNIIALYKEQFIVLLFHCQFYNIVIFIIT